jgi:antitoxin (DNA-binding transcriptional repressor) of toxin-antitoxin stability system
MQFVAVRDLRVRPGEVWQKLNEQDELVLTSNGRPMAIIAKVAENEVEQMLAALRRARAQLAVSRLRQAAVAQGLDRMKPDEIETEIAQARRERA